MPQSRQRGTKRQRGSYSSLICLGCRQRRIRCELPSTIEVPNDGELRALQTPCQRCKRLGVPCVIRKTILGRPGIEKSPTIENQNGFRPSKTGHFAPHIILELAERPLAPAQNEAQVCVSCVVTRFGSPASSDPLRSQRPQSCPHWNGDALLLHIPQSPETAFISRALDTLRSELVEDEWFRHLPSHYGRTSALDLSVRAIVIACSYARGVPRITSNDCYQGLALAINAVQADLKQSGREPSDDLLASTALLAPFEGVINKNGIPTTLHVGGLAAILLARPATYPVTQLAREIVDFHAGETAIMACIQNVHSPFEDVDQAYFGYSDGDQNKLKALGNELFIRLPRLVKLTRMLRLQSPPQNKLLLEASRLANSLHRLEDPKAEQRLLQKTEILPPRDVEAPTPLRHCLYYPSVKDFEALVYYWQSRLSILRLEWRLLEMFVSNHAEAKITGEDASEVFFQSCFGPRVKEMIWLATHILASLDYARTLRLHKHARLFAHAMVVVWGVIMDIPSALSDDESQGETNRLPELLVRGVNLKLRAVPHLTAEDLDIAADIFVGGQPTGRFAQLYGL